MSQFTIRPARAEDTAAVLAFSQDMLAEDDDMQLNWERWMADPNGVLAIAVLDGTPIGVAHMVLLTAEESWLEGVQVHPAQRRRGTGTALLLYCFERARERGAVIMRTTAASDNLIAQALLQQAGFIPTGSYMRFEALTDDATPDPLAESLIRQPGGEMLEAIWQWLERSNNASLVGGLLLPGPRGFALTDEQLRKHLAAGEVALLEQWDEVQGIAIAAPQPRQGDLDEAIYTIAYLDGTTAESYGRLALHVRLIAAAEGYTRVEARAPDLYILVDALNGAGFVRADEVLHTIYYRDLT